MMRRCEDCLFWDNNHGYVEYVGFCRRYPPQFHSKFDDDYEGASDENSIASWNFPLMLYGDWCGEFKPKDDSETQD